ncbi:MAG: DUF2853 family protein [Sulfurovum sp.]|nr:DUF2853 family protein [Sulfurovum sp.]
MEKKSIFEKIDTMYTKVVKVIIGDLPIEELKPNNTVSSTTKENAKQTKYIYTSLKDKFLNLGVPESEKELLYTEVVKREKQEAKETSKRISSKEEPLKRPSTKTVTKKKTSKNKVKNTENTTSKTKMTKKAPERTKIKEKETAKTASTKKSKVKKTTTAERKEKTKAKTKTKAAPRGAQKAAKIALYVKDIKKYYGEVDEEFVAIIVKNLGPSIYKKDAELVSCSDPKELDTVRKSFLIKKLGIDASQSVLDAAIQDVCVELKNTRNKYRATFYYALAKKFKKESVLN